MVLINDFDDVVPTMPRCCAECLFCDIYCLILRRGFKPFNPNTERYPDCPLADVHVDEDGILHVVR